MKGYIRGMSSVMRRMKGLMRSMKVVIWGTDACVAGRGCGAADDTAGNRRHPVVKPGVTPCKGSLKPPRPGRHYRRVATASDVRNRSLLTPRRRHSVRPMQPRRRDIALQVRGRHCSTAATDVPIVREHA